MGPQAQKWTPCILGAPRGSFAFNKCAVGPEPDRARHRWHNMDEPRLWTGEERAAYYRQKAKDALVMAASSSLPSTRLAFEALAAKWTEMANSIENFEEH